MTAVCLLGAWHRVNDTRLFTKMARSLACAGYEVSIVGQSRIDEIAMKDGVRLIGISGWDESGNRSLIGMATRFMWKCYRAAWDQDALIYHVHDPLGIPFGIFATLAGRRVLYDVHEYYDQTVRYKEDFSPLLRLFYAALIFLIEPILCQIARAVIVVDENMTRYDKYGAVTVHNFQPRDMFVPIQEKKTRVRVRLFTDGDLGEHRATFELIKGVSIASREVPVMLDLYGRFLGADYEKQCRQLIVDENLVDIVRIHEWVPHLTLARLTALADIGLIPFEKLKWLMNVGYPNKLSQYCGCGLPIISADLPRLAENVKRIGCGISVDCSDPEEIAKAITMLARQPEIRIKYGANARQAVETWMNWEHEVETLLRVYRQAIA